MFSAVSLSFGTFLKNLMDFYEIQSGRGALDPEMIDSGSITETIVFPLCILFI